MNKTLVYLVSGIILSFMTSLAGADTLKDDIAEHMYFRRTSDQTQLTPERKNFQDALNKRDKEMCAGIRSYRLNESLENRMKREGFSFEDAVDEINAGLISGMTTEREAMQWFGKPLEVVDNEVLPWHMTNGRIAYHIGKDMYPAPKPHQKIIEKKFYMRENNTPQQGICLEVLLTVNKCSGLVEHYQYYFETGSIIPSWTNAIITKG